LNVPSEFSEMLLLKNQKPRYALPFALIRSAAK